MTEERKLLTWFEYYLFYVLFETLPANKFILETTIEYGLARPAE